LFTIVDAWRNLFETACDRIGQNRKYGLENLRQVRRYYPGVSAVYYTRKSLISDAVAMFQAGADGLFIKPTGTDDAETRLLTRKYAPKLIEELARVCDCNIENLKARGNFYANNPSETETTIEQLVKSWRRFRDK
jgi:DNA-binding NarL/FixJ family response regulator